MQVIFLSPTVTIEPGFDPWKSELLVHTLFQNWNSKKILLENQPCNLEWTSPNIKSKHYFFEILQKADDYIKVPWAYIDHDQIVSEPATLIIAPSYI